jgi:hypothetical protein
MMKSVAYHGPGCTNWPSDPHVTQPTLLSALSAHARKSVSHNTSPRRLRTKELELVECGLRLGVLCNGYGITVWKKERLQKRLHGSADKIRSIASNPDVAELSYH